MDIVLERLAALEALAAVCAVIPRTTTIEALKYALIEASEGMVTISGTSIDAGVRREIVAATDKPGSVCVPAHDLFATLRTAPGSEVRIRSDERRARITCGAAKASLGTIHAHELPAMPTRPADLVATVDGSELGRALAACVHSCHTAPGAPDMRGCVAIAPHGSGLAVEATDGLTMSSVVIPGEIEGPGILLWEKHARMWAKFAPDGPAKLYARREHLIWMDSPGAGYSAATIAGTPRIRRDIVWGSMVDPEMPAHVVAVADLISAVKFAGTHAAATFPSALLRFGAEGVEVSSTDGVATGQIMVESESEGERPPSVVGLQIPALLDTLAACPWECVKIRALGDNPVLFSDPDAESGEGDLFVIMPINGG